MRSPLSSKDTLDRLLLKCYYYSLFTTSKNNEIWIKPFLFEIHPHSTGNSVTGWIINDNDERYEFLNGTWWFHNRYTFNNFK